MSLPSDHEPRTKATIALASIALASFGGAACTTSPVGPEPEAAADTSSAMQLRVEQVVADHGFRPPDVRVLADPGETRYSLRVGDVPIWGLDARVSGKKVRMADVRFDPSFAVDTRPRISPGGAFSAALDALGDPSARLSSSELVLLPREEQRLIAALPDSRKPNAKDFERVITDLTLIYRLHLTTGGAADEPEQEWLAQIDAGTGEVVDLAPTGLQVETYQQVTILGKYSGKKRLHTLYDGGEHQFVLKDTFRNVYQTYAGDDFVSNDDLFGDGELFLSGSATDGANGETAAVDAMYAVVMTWRFFGDILARSGPNGHGTPLKVRLHRPGSIPGQYLPYEKGAELAFGYMSTTPDPVTHRLIPATAMDIVAHELAHDFFMNEVYAEPWNAPTANSELYGINEATGDIFGMLTEMYRDVVEPGLPLSTLDTLGPANKYLTMGEQTGISVGSPGTELEFAL